MITVWKYLHHTSGKVTNAHTHLHYNRVRPPLFKHRCLSAIIDLFRLMKWLKLVYLYTEFHLTITYKYCTPNCIIRTSSILVMFKLLCFVQIYVTGPAKLRASVHKLH